MNTVSNIYGINSQAIELIQFTHLSEWNKSRLLWDALVTSAGSARGDVGLFSTPRDLFPALGGFPQQRRTRSPALDNPSPWNSRDTFSKPQVSYIHQSVLTSGLQGEVHQSHRWRGRVINLGQGTICLRRDGGLWHREHNLESNTDGQHKN